MVRYRDRILPVPLAQIAIIYIENDIIYLQTFKQKSYIIQQTIDEIEKLAEPIFFRVNRRSLVNRSAIAEASHSMHRKLKITFSFPFLR